MPLFLLWSGVKFWNETLNQHTEVASETRKKCASRTMVHMSSFVPFIFWEQNRACTWIMPFTELCNAPSMYCAMGYQHNCPFGYVASQAMHTSQHITSHIQRSHQGAERMVEGIQGP